MRWWNCQKDSLLSGLEVSSQAGLIHGSARPSPDAQVWREFEFTSTRRSVEHLHPQTELIEGEEWAGEHLHALGNLCLVSHACESRNDRWLKRVCLCAARTRAADDARCSMSLRSVCGAHSIGKCWIEVAVRGLSNGGMNPVSVRCLGWVNGAEQSQPSKKSSYIRPYVVGKNKASICFS